MLSALIRPTFSAGAGILSIGLGSSLFSVSSSNDIQYQYDLNTYCLCAKLVWWKHVAKVTGAKNPNAELLEKLARVHLETLELLAKNGSSKSREK